MMMTKPHRQFIFLENSNEIIKMKLDSSWNCNFASASEKMAGGDDVILFKMSSIL